MTTARRRRRQQRSCVGVSILVFFDRTCAFSGSVAYIGNDAMSGVRRCRAPLPSASSLFVSRKERPNTSHSLISSDILDGLNLTASETKRVLRSIGSDDEEKRLKGLVRARRLIQYFCSSRIGMTEESAKKVLLKRPRLMQYSQSKIRNNTNFFLNEMHMSKEEYEKMVKLDPNVLLYSVDKRLRPVLDFFRDEIGSSKWKWIASRYPQVFSHSVNQTLRPRSSFLYQGLGLKRWSDLSQIASKFPPVMYSLPEHNILAKMDYLKETLALSTSELRDIIVTYPQVLGLSLENNLQPTVEFLLSTDGANLSVEQLSDSFSYQPSLLAYSLENRIRPRIGRMNENNISFSYSPPVIMSYTDRAFDEWLEMQTTTWSITS